MSNLTNFQAVNLYKLSQTEEFGQVSFKQPRQYLLVQRNVKNLKELYDSLVEAEKKVTEPSAEFAEFDSERKELITPYLVKDENGEVVLDEKGIPTPIEEYKQTVETIFRNLLEKHKTAIEENNKKLLSWSEFLHSEAEVKIDLIPVDDVTLPDLGFNNIKFSILSLMLEISEEY